mgnify:CR=1 FL=1
MNYYDDKIKICMSQFYIQFTLRTDASLVSVANNDSGNLNELEALRLGRALLFVADALFGAARLNIDTLAIFNRLPKPKILRLSVCFWPKLQAAKTNFAVRQ